MRIVILTHYYVPEKTAIGPLTADLAEEMARRGHEVTVITGMPNYPEWRVHEGYRGKLYMREMINGVEVRRSYVFVPSSKTTPKRVLYDCSVAASCLPNLLSCRRPDLVVSVSVPLQLTMSGWLAAALWRTPQLMILQDIVPDVALDVGMLKNERLVRFAHRLEMFCYRHVCHISVICDGFRENLSAKGVPEEKLTVIPNWVDTEAVRPMNRMGPFREKHGFDEQVFIVLYGGSMSMKQGLANILRAARIMRDNGRVHFVLVGEGKDKETLVRMASEERLSNLSLMPFEPKEMFPHMLAAADVLLLNQLPAVSDTVLPSKFMNYMSAGRPTVAAVNAASETARYLELAECGIRVEPDQPEALARAIEEMCSNTERAKKLAENGRAFAERNLARTQALDRFETLFETLGRGNGGQSGSDAV